MRKYVVIDTNVLVSGLLTRNEFSPTLKILKLLADNTITPVYSSEIIKEYREVSEIVQVCETMSDTLVFCTFFTQLFSTPCFQPVPVYRTRRRLKSSNPYTPV